MSTSLSIQTFSRLEAATRVLVSPLAMPNADAWREEVMRTLCELFEASGATFYLPSQERMVQAFGRASPVETQIGSYTAATWTGLGRSRDPILDEFHDALIRSGTTVWNMESADHDLLGGSGRAWRSVFYNEVLKDAGAHDTHAVFLPTAQGSVMVSVHDFYRAPEDDEHFPLLRTLRPALVAGLDAFYRLDAHRAALDAVTEPVAVFDSGGGETHRNPALSGLLAGDPDAARVEAALSVFARRLRPLGFPRLGEAACGCLPTAEVQTAGARYAFRATLLPPDGLGFGEAFLVTVTAEGEAPVFPSVEEARARHGLTAREAEVALLVARGLSNDAIAERLFVSRHTVRHHLEGAMAKLELTGRGREAVAARLLGADAIAEAA